ncbi:MAG: SgcJ/EcaC family oxidoreductase [Gemmatales bacterium]
MSHDERAIRNLQQDWLKATAAKDLPAIMNMMADDIVFLTPGQPPFGKKEFAASFEKMKQIDITGTGVMDEVVVVGDFAYAQSRLEISIRPPGGESKHLAGYTLAVYRKLTDGRWVLARDANMVAPK